MPHSYKSEYPPGVQVDEGIKSFFEEFYKISDTPEAHEKYADSFTEGATLVIASKKGVGREGPDGGEANSREQMLLGFYDHSLVVPASIQSDDVTEILKIRKGMWAAVSSRSHTPIKIFPFGSGSSEVMLYGKVAYTFKVGGGSEIEWAARANMVQEGESWKIAFYQVYLDTAAMQNVK